MEYLEYCKELENKIIAAYEDSITMADAERLAGEFLRAQLVISNELKKADLASRMRKQGVKAIRAALYTDICSKNEKKPTEAAIAALLDSNEIVSSEQQSFDEAEVSRDELERYYNIFQNSHIYFRNIARGNMG